MATDFARLEAEDRAARARAIDVSRSFLVQAPAGSGKTGLLIARVLALLAIVERPEKVLAMTFTRKAAAEMRERVLRALRDAAEATPVDAANQHEAMLRALAAAALARDATSGWNLLANPSRLRVVTIDALATGLTRQVPVTTGLGAPSAFVDDATALYQAAVRDALAESSVEDPHWRVFLAYLDNDAERVVALLAGMLARREQWLRLSTGQGGGDLRAWLESALQRETENGLLRVRALLPPDLRAELPVHQRYAAQALAVRLPEVAAILATMADDGGLPSAGAAKLEAWSGLADWLLVKGEPNWRRKLTVNNGFPAKDKGEGATQREAAKMAMESWLAKAGTVPGLAKALDAVRALPPTRFSDEAWAFVDATLALLPALAARLSLVFARRGEIDFAEATLRALAALGDAEEPEELLLAADLRYEHILIDEFQDTSASQVELLGRLTGGWEEGDGRTLFAVGDPMQSIYRFREADVRFFLEAQQAGRINQVPIEFLRLTRNFRSQRPVIDWVNAIFPTVLAPVSDPDRGEVAYDEVAATRESPSDPLPTVDVATDAEEEAALVVAHVARALDEGSRDIAILVRARTHLAAILPALRRGRVDYAAVDLESLAERLATRDLLTLIRALVQPHDRIAALALLRAPWCGLTLADLLAVTQARPTGALLDLLGEPMPPGEVSADGIARLSRLRDALQPALQTSGRTALAPRVRAAWLALGGPACAPAASDLAGSARLFALLARHERGGDLPAWDEFDAAAGRLFAAPATAAAAPVQVMTLHKAKGLEFDTVILPGLARRVSRSDDPPLRWKRRGGSADDARLLLAPMHARTGAGTTRDPVYRYLQGLDAEEGEAELGRLLYVGCTRAKRRLHLVAALSPEADSSAVGRQWKPPGSTSALARLWPMVEDTVATPPPPAPEADTTEVELPPALVRLPVDFAMPAPPSELELAPAAADLGPPMPAYDWAQATAAAIGTVAHRILAQFHRDGIGAWSPGRVDAEHGRILAELVREEVPVDASEAAVRSVQEVIERTLADDRGRWLFATAHDDAHSEWALAGVENGRIVHVSIDRSFVADGVRYIVDFKTGRHEGGDVDAFLAREVERYRPQLERYACLVRHIDARPIRLALFHPRVPGGWREWPAEVQPQATDDPEIR